MQFDSLA